MNLADYGTSQLGWHFWFWLETNYWQTLVILELGLHRRTKLAFENLKLSTLGRNSLTTIKTFLLHRFRQFCFFPTSFFLSFLKARDEWHWPTTRV
jgi:hypothetical protein